MPAPTPFLARLRAATRLPVATVAPCSPGRSRHRRLAVITLANFGLRELMAVVSTGIVYRISEARDLA